MGDALVEFLVDDVRFTGTRYLCDSFTAPSAQAPNEVGNTLLLSPDYSETRLEWSPPAVDATHDAAAFYQIYSSSTPDGGFSQDDETTATHHLDARSTSPGEAVYFVVGTTNSGGSSGEEPAP